MTNAIVTLMHTTAAYQAAVAQLLIGEANFVGKQLELPGWRAIQKTNEVKVDVNLPTSGLGGILETSDYRFWYSDARLSRVERIKRMEAPRRNWPTDEEFLQLKPLVGTNESRVLARNWLHAIGVETNRLELEHSFQAHQPRIRITAPGVVPPQTSPIPFHVLNWSPPGVRYPGDSEFSVQVRADTKELWNVQFPRTNHFMTRRLALTNKAELLGPLPPSRKFVEDMFGGMTQFRVVALPTKVEAVLLRPNERGRALVARRGPVQVRGALASQLSESLTSFESYAWTARTRCIPDYGVWLCFHQGTRKVVVLLCFQCSEILIDGKPGESFSFAHGALLKTIREVFPDDEALEKLKSERGNWADFYKGMEQQLRYHEAKERQ